MQLRDSPEEAAFRDEVRAWLADNLPDDLPRPARRRGAVRGVGARVEPQARRGRLRGADLAEGVRRRRRAVLAPGDPARGAGTRAGARPHRRDRPRDGRADDHRPRDRRAEGALPAEDPLGRGDLVPGLLRAGRRLRPRVGAHARRARSDGRYVVNGQKVWSSYAHLADWCILVTLQRPGRAALPGADVPPRRHARAGRRGAAADPDHRRGRVQRDLLRRRRGAGRERDRRARTGLAGGDDDADARAGGARIRALRRVRGRGPQAARAGARPRPRRPAPRPDRARPGSSSRR